MAAPAPILSQKRAFSLPVPSAFTETAVWRSVGSGWRRLHGSFRDLGYSIEWHDFKADSDLDWGRSFHAQSLEICLNLEGHGEVQAGSRKIQFAPLTAGLYLQDQPRLQGIRARGESHRFITIELSFDFLRRNVSPGEPGLHPRLRRLFRGKVTAEVSDPIRLTSEHQQIVLSLRRPPVYAAAQRMWYQAKALEVAAAFLYSGAEEEELFCQRQKRLNQERVQRVIALLKENLAEPPDLEEIGRRVGCSHYHLSRLFSEEMGRGIFQYLRDLRMERAAELLRQGRMKVIDVALEVGYSSPGHFSTAFHETFGCCPGLYPVKTGPQHAAEGTRT